MSTQTGVPAEWEQQSALLISWPHGLAAPQQCALEKTLRELIAPIANYQPVVIACHDAELIGRLAIELGDIWATYASYTHPMSICGFAPMARLVPTLMTP